MDQIKIKDLIIHVIFFLKIDSKNPAPGDYCIKSDFDGTGRSFLSKYKSSGARTLSSRIPSIPQRFQSIFKL